MPISETAHRLFDALDAHDLVILDAFLRDDFQLTGNITRPMGKREFLALLGAYFQAFSNYDFHFSEANQEGNVVRAMIATTGIHDGTLDLAAAGIPVTVAPTDKSISTPPATGVFTFDSDDLVAALEMNQPAGGGLSDLLAQLGAEMPTG
jgi:hypothetical protein